MDKKSFEELLSWVAPFIEKLLLRRSAETAREKNNTCQFTLLMYRPTHKSLLALVTKLAQRQWEVSFRKPVGQYGISLTRKDSLNHQPPRKNS